MTKKFGFWLICIGLLTVSLPCLTWATSTISQGFSSDDELSMGSIVSLKTDTTDTVVASTTNNIEGILGIVINDGSSWLTLSNGQKNQVQVATSGTASVLVSNINGDVLEGDQITASPIKGVGMKATSNTKVIGIAQGKASTTKTQEFTNADGKKQTVALDLIPIQVNVAYFFKEPEKSIIPQSIQSLANAIAGKSVNTVPIIISGAIFIITLIVVVCIVYAMIKSSIISVGRNPMAQSAVYRDVIQLSALVVIILAVSLTTIYIILTRF